MLKAIRQRVRDAQTLNALHVGAEQHANRQGQREPGAEHFILAALDLPDGTAAAAFARLGITPSAFAAAIETQYLTALASLGLEGDGVAGLADTIVAVEPSSGLYKTQVSAQEMMRVLTHEVMLAAQKQDEAAPLLSAHVLLAATAARRGVTARTLQALGLSPEQVASAAHDVLALA